MAQICTNLSGIGLVGFCVLTAVVATDSVLGFALEVKLLGHLCSGIVTELIKNAI
jgi:hypothetical protein